MHQPPLLQVIIFKLDIASLDGIEDVLRPRHEQPDYGAALVRDGLQDLLRLRTRQQDSAAARHEASHPVHLRAGVVQWRNAEEGVVAAGLMMLRLHLSRLSEAPVRVKDGLREAGGSG